jgi:hypothetical protein
MCVFDDSLAPFGFSPRNYLIKKIRATMCQNLLTIPIIKEQNIKMNRDRVDLKAPYKRRQRCIDLQALTDCLKTIEQENTNNDCNDDYPMDSWSEPLSNPFSMDESE